MLSEWGESKWSLSLSYSPSSETSCLQLKNKEAVLFQSPKKKSIKIPSLTPQYIWTLTNYISFPLQVGRTCTADRRHCEAQKFHRQDAFSHSLCISFPKKSVIM